MVKTQVQEIGPNKVSMLVEVGKDKVSAAFSSFFQKAANSINIPGFRRGKIPKPVLVKYIGQESIHEQISEELLHDAYPQALREAKIFPVSPVDIKETHLKEGEAFTFTAEVEVRPKLPEFSYTGKTANVQRVLVSDDSVGKVIERLREQFGKLTPIEEGTLEFGDYFLANIQAKVDGIIDPELSDEKAYRKFVEEGEAFLPMKGMKPNETRNFSNTVNRDEDKNSSYFGKTIDYTVTLEKISRPVLSELNDEFAKEVGNYQSLDELKTKIREDLEERFKNDAELRAIDHLLMEMDKSTEFSVPEGMVQRTIDFFVQSLDRKWRQMGTSLEDYLKKSGKSMDEFRSGFRDKAVAETRLMLIVDAISDREKLDVEDSEYRAEVEKRAREHGVAVEKLLSYLSQGKGEEDIKNSLLKKKVDDFLLKNNQIHFDMVNELELNKGDSHGDACTHSH